MQNKARKLLPTMSLFFGMLMAATSLPVGYAQVKSDDQKNVDKAREQEEQEMSAKKVVSESAIASIFLDKVTVKDADWKLKKAWHTMRGGVENKATTNLSFEKETEKVYIRILEFTSEDEVLEHSKTPRSGGISVNFNTYGDGGEKIFISGNFVLLHFRKGNVFVTINCQNEKIAERFAGYVAESLANQTSK
jgi:hypothetical protein